MRKVKEEEREGAREGGAETESEEEREGGREREVNIKRV